ncbi:MAG: serine hydrolase [Notoacmeibacter sp.]|nr:serine hydrolase [Notoacmeibacter sp.]MCC0033548.1 serine hydrolase [Brucellaceae bacterium]
MKRISKWAAGLLLMVLIVAAGWLAAAPPDMVRVATNYAAKMVCSNVFVAGRDAAEVMAVDVQAPGHPIFRAITVEVDRDAQPPRVQAKLLGIFGTGGAVWRGPKLGCSSVPDVGLLHSSTFIEGEVPPDPAREDAALWPDGETVEPSQDPALAAILDDRVLTGPGMRAVVVVHNGRIIGERYAGGFTKDTPLLGWSMTKTVTGALVGAAMRDGGLARDKAALFDTWNDEGRKAITLTQMMEMSSGLAWNEGYGSVSDVTRMLYLTSNMAGFAASRPYDPEMGNPKDDRLFNYSSGTSVMLSDIWMRAVKEPKGYPWRALFHPLGMTSATFETDANGTFVGSSYLYATPRDWARFAQLLLQRGAWKGQAVLPAGHVDWMMTPAPASVAPWGKPEYARQLWLHGPEGGIDGKDPEAAFSLPPDAFWMRGHDGQTITIMPSLNLIVLRMGLTPSKLKYQPQGLVEAVVRHLRS